MVVSASSSSSSSRRRSSSTSPTSSNSSSTMRIVDIVVAAFWSPPKKFPDIPELSTNMKHRIVESRSFECLGPHRKIQLHRVAPILTSQIPR